jgi:hypothetical protein
MPTPVAVTPIKAPVAVVPKAAEPEAKPEAEQLYQVMEDIKIPRGASSFMLRAGKVISNRGYDIPTLLRCGAKLGPPKS